MNLLQMRIADVGPARRNGKLTWHLADLLEGVLLRAQIEALENEWSGPRIKLIIAEADIILEDQEPITTPIALKSDELSFSGSAKNDIASFEFILKADATANNWWCEMVIASSI